MENKILHLPKKLFNLRFKAPNKINEVSVKKFYDGDGVLHIDNNGIGNILIKARDLEKAKQKLEEIIGEEVEYV